MKPRKLLGIFMGLVVLVLLCSRAKSTKPSRAEFIKEDSVARAQVPTWSPQDMDFFLHGSMSTEVVPEAVLHAFIKTFPDLFPNPDLSHFGLIPDPEFGWPIGFSRKQVPHLDGLSAIGTNCAACHVAQITAKESDKPVRILGVASHFDAEAYFGAVTVAGFRTGQPENMEKNLLAFLNDGATEKISQASFESAWSAQQQKIESVISVDPAGAKEVR